MPVSAPDRNSMLRSSPRAQAVYLAVDLVLMPIAFFVPYILRYNSMSELFGGMQFPNLTEHCFVFAFWGILVVIAFRRKRLYSIKRDVSIPRELLQVVVCIFLTSIAVGAVVFFAKYKFFSRPVFFGSCVMLCVLLGGWRTLNRLVLKRLIKGGSLNINVLIVGAGEVGKMTHQELRKRPHWGFRTSGFLDESREGVVDGVPVLGTLADFTEIARKHFVDEVIVTLGLESKAVSRLVTQAQAMRLGVRIVPEHLEKPLPILDVTYLGMIPLLTYKDRTPHPSKSLAKKLFDFAAALVLLVLLFPAFVILAILIKIGSRGSVFYVQERVGLKGRIFRLYKFRSMIRGADKLQAQLLERNEAKGGVIFKMKQDPRVTKVGKWMRRYSLDELPQLLDVLNGSMSLVGPRPPLPEEVAEYNNSHMERLSIKPGITGMSQTRGRSDLPFSRWVRWDLWYINHWSFWLDLRILLWTIPAALKGRGAY